MEQFDNIRTLFHNAGLDASGVDATEAVGVDGVVIVQADPSSSQSTVQSQISGLTGFSMLEHWDENDSPDSRQIYVPPIPDDEGDEGGSGSGSPVDRDLSGLNGPGLINGFDGINETMTADPPANPIFPPDPIGAAGPSSFIEAVNVSLAIFSKTTGAITSGGGDSTFFSDFFASSNSGFMENELPKLSDPLVVFNENAVNPDSSIGQFYVSIFEFSDVTQQSRLDVAISDSNSPITLSSTDWKFYRFDTTDSTTNATRGTVTNFNSDYPRGIQPRGLCGDFRYVPLSALRWARPPRPRL